MGKWWLEGVEGERKVGEEKEMGEFGVESVVCLGGRSYGWGGGGRYG